MVAPTDDEGEWWCDAMPRPVGNMESADGIVMNDDQSISRGGC